VSGRRRTKGTVVVPSGCSPSPPRWRLALHYAPLDLSPRRTGLACRHSSVLAHGTRQLGPISRKGCVGVVVTTLSLDSAIHNKRWQLAAPNAKLSRSR